MTGNEDTDLDLSIDAVIDDDGNVSLPDIDLLINGPNVPVIDDDGGILLDLDPAVLVADVAAVRSLLISN